MTGVTVDTNTLLDLSPIPVAHGSKHLIYSSASASASSTHFSPNLEDLNSSNKPYSIFPRNVFNGDETVMSLTPRSAFSTSSSMFEAPSVAINEDSNQNPNSYPRNSGNQYPINLHNPLLRGHYGSYGIPDSHRVEPQQGQTNLLISSANYFPET